MIAPAQQLTPRRSAIRDYLPIAITAALLALVPLRYHESRTLMGVVVTGLLFAAYGIAFNIIFGSTGQLFLCVGALAGVGGYGSAILSDEIGVPMPLSMALGTALAALIGGLLSWIAVRRSLDVIFTGIMTLAFSLAFGNLLLGRRELTGGESGLRVSAGADTFLRDQVPPYYAFLVLVVLFLVVYRLVQRSSIGWAFRALRDDEMAAELAGVDVRLYRVLAGLIGSAMLGLAGSLYAHSEGFIGPSTYAFGRVDIRVIVIVAFGGIGSLLGPVLGAVVFTWLDERLVSFVELRVILYGVIVIALFLGFPRGVIPTVQSVLAGRSRRRRRRAPSQVSAGDVVVDAER